MGVHPKVCPPTERKYSSVSNNSDKIFPQGVLELYTITEEEERRHRRLEYLLCRYLQFD